MSALVSPLQPAVEAELNAENSTHENDGHLPGMRREWNFTLTFLHEAARVQLLCPPHWEPGFIEPERIEELSRLDRDVKHCPMTPALRFMDFSSQSEPAVMIAVGTGNNTSNAIPSGLPRDLTMQRGTQVEILYSHIPPFMTLAAYCVGSVQHVLKNPNVIAVDGQKRLSRLKIGRKLRCPHRLGGHPSFHFYYSVHQKTELVTHDVVYCIGTIIGQRGYLVTVRCADAEELEGYLNRMFLPYFCNPTNLRLDANVTYSEVPSAHLLSERSPRYGELKYEDRDAALSFSLPMHPLRVRPDFSPTKTVGVGSIACMTLELNVYENLIDDAAVAEITGMPKYKINQVLLCVEVEDVARMNYPGVMTTDEYSELKTRRLLDVLQGAKVVGTPTSLQLGPRIGRSHTITFEYEPFSGPTKAMYVSTLLGNFGVTAYYLTKLGGGYFETHLYIYKQLLGRLQYQQQHKANITFSRFDVVNVRLLETELYRAYTSAPVDQRHVFLEHLKALAESNDGNTDGADEIPVPEEEGGYVRPPRGVWGQTGSFMVTTATASAHTRGGSFSQSNLNSANESGTAAVSAAVPVPLPAAPAASGAFRRGSKLEGGTAAVPRMEEAFAAAPPPGEEEEEEDRVSSHSQSLISVTSIPHLQASSESDESVAELPTGITPASAVRETGSSANANGSSITGGGPELEALSAAGSGSRRGSAAWTNSEAGAAVGRRSSAHNTMMMGAGGSVHSVHGGVEGSGGLLVSPSAVTPGGYPSGGAFSGLDGEEVAGGGEGSTRISSNDRAGTESPLELPPPSCLTREMLTGPAARMALEGEDKRDKEPEPSLKDVYLRCCEEYQCKPNSYLLSRLPADPRYSDLVEELDVSSNYVGHTGFMAILSFVEHLPNIQHVHFNGMSLNNVDIENLCEVLGNHPSICSIHLRNNPKITLPSTKLLFRLLRLNRGIRLLSLHGTRIGDSVIAKLEALAAENACLAPHMSDGVSQAGLNDAELSEAFLPNANGSQTESVDINIP